MRVIAIVALCELASCAASSGFDCSDDAQCGAGGVCAAPGHCAFEDPACDSGLVFGAHAGDLAGTCVAPEGGSEGHGVTDDTRGSSTSEGSSGTQGPGTTPPADSTVALDDGFSTTDGGIGETGPTSTTSASDTELTSDGSTGAPPITVELVADLALCAYPDNPDPAPAQCEASAGADAFTVDLDETSSGFGQAAGYLAFTRGLEVGGAALLEVTLRVRTSTATNAATDHAGEVWQVEAFDQASLALATPAPIGAAPIAADVGPVAVDAEAIWSLPVDLLEGGGALHLAVVPISTNGADYLDAGSAAPPVIEATLAP